MSQSPRVLLIVTDELRAHALGYAGDVNAHTPNVDRLASEAINYTEAVSGLPVCSPARASFMTGQYPLQHGVYINDVPLEPTAPTIAELFVEHGYRTGYIGKWHLYGSPDGVFERRQAFIPPDARCGFEYWKVGECTHDYNHSFFYEGDDPTKKYWDGYDAIAQTDDAIGFIRDADIPYFLTVSYGPPHFPLQSAPEVFRKRYADADIALRPNVPAACSGAAVHDLRGYYAHIAAIDECVGRLLEATDAENTIVVFTSDHGDMLWSQGLEYKLTPWEESIRVPLLIRSPGCVPAKTSRLFNSPDLMPTLLGFAGIAAPRGIAGADLSLDGERPATAFLGAPAAYSSLRRCGIDEYRGVRDERYTYVRSIHGPWLLYDRLTDPYQRRNLIGDHDHDAVLERLEAELDGWLRLLDDEFRDGVSYLERDGLDHYFEVHEPLGFSGSENGDWQSTNTRGRLYSIDTALTTLIEESAARELVERLVPALLAPSDTWTVKHSPRIAVMADPALAPVSALAELDRSLTALGSRSGLPREGAAPSPFPARARLDPSAAPNRRLPGPRIEV